MADQTVIESIGIEVLSDRTDTRSSVVDHMAIEVLGKRVTSSIIQAITLEVLYSRRTQAIADTIILETLWGSPTILVSGTATGVQSASLLRDTSKTFITNQYSLQQVKITGGTGSGQVRTIKSNDVDSVTVTSNWTITPVAASSTYELLYVKKLIVDKMGVEVMYI